jgi:stearoyl-CoA desaturase (delta-9 desaturase)
MYLLLPIHFLMGPVHGAIVNWAGHKYGYRNFNENDYSKNTLVFDFLMLGELFQNNHHHAGARANFAAKWWEIDPVYPIIILLDKVKIIRLVRNK